MKFRSKYFAIFMLFAVFTLCMANEYHHLRYGQSLYESLNTPAALTSSELEWLQRRGGLKYGETYDALPPMQQEGLTQHQGYSIDLISMMSVDMKIPISFIMLNWEDMLGALDDGLIDFTNVSYSPERAQKYLLSKPLYKTKGIVLVNDGGGEKLTEIKQLEGMTVAAQKIDHVVAALANKAPAINIRLCENLVACVQLLKDRQVDAIAGDELNIMYSMQKDALYQEHYILPEPAYVADAVMAVRQSEPDLLQIINKVITILDGEGSLEKVMQKWFVSSLHVSRMDGRSKYILIIGTALGTLAFIIALFSIINAETKSLVKKRTAELNLSKKNLETTLNAIPYWLIEVDTKKRVVAVNEKFLRDNGILEAETILSTDCRLERFTNSPPLLDMIDQAFALQHSVMKEITINGRIFDVSCSPLHSDGDSVHILVVMDDVTKARVAEKQVIQSSKMATIGQLAAGISHELRNPLGLIRNGNYVLKNNLGDEDEIDQTYRMIEEAITSADTMVESLLNFSRIPPETSLRVNLHEIIGSILNIRKKQFAQKNITVVFDCPENFPVTCKPDGMQSIINNLVSNAVQAMPPGGTLLIRCRKHRNHTSLFIIDNGCGIAPKDQEWLFTPFFTTKPLGEGTGLGLYVVYNHVKEHGGEIAAYSWPGKNTVFHITLPHETAG